MNERASQTHLDAAGAAEQRPCKECTLPFTPRRSWAEFCKNKCRNDFHAREARIEAIRARAVQMYEALRAVAASKVCSGAGPEYCAHCIAGAAIKDLKAP